MNWRPTWVLLAVSAGVLAFIILVERPLRVAHEQQAGRVILPGLNPAAVTNLEIHPWGQPVIQAVRASSGSNTWRLAQPVAYPAFDERIAGALQALAELEWVDRVTEKELRDRPNAQEEFGFTKPCYTVLLQGAGFERRLEIGDVGAFNDRISVQVVGNNAIYEAGTDFLRWFSTNKNEWRDRTLLSLTNLAFQTLHVRAAGKEFDLERNQTNQLWIMRKPLLARADTAKINDLLAVLQTVTVSAFVTDDPQADLETYGPQNTDATPILELSFLNGTNRVAGLQVGRSPTNYPNLAFVRRMVAGNIVAAPKAAVKVWQMAPTNFLDQHFISLSPALVESISVRGDDDFVARKQNEEQWQVAAGKVFPADATLMFNWLGSLTNVPTEIVKTVVTDFTPYGLNRPRPLLQYIIHFAPAAGAQADATIEFGTNQAGQVFERRLGEDFVNTISREDFDVMPRDSWQLRDRRIWSFESSNVVSVTVHQLGGTVKFLRDPEGNWTYAPGFSSQVGINSPALEECVLRLGRLQAIWWDGAGHEQLDKFGFAKAAHEVVLETKQGGTNQTYRIQFGERSPRIHPYASVVLGGQEVIFEFPADLFENLVEPNLTLYTARRFLR